MSFYPFLIGALVVWRLTHLLAAEDGPWDLVVRLRRGLGAGFLGRLMDCFHCLSLWVALPVTLALTSARAATWPPGRLSDWMELGLLWLALSGAAILLQRIGQPWAPPPAPYLEEEEDDGLLR